MAVALEAGVPAGTLVADFWGAEVAVCEAGTVEADVAVATGEVAVAPPVGTARVASTAVGAPLATPVVGVAAGLGLEQPSASNRIDVSTKIDGDLVVMGDLLRWDRNGPLDTGAVR